MSPPLSLSFNPSLGAELVAAVQSSDAVLGELEALLARRLLTEQPRRAGTPCQGADADESGDEADLEEAQELPERSSAPPALGGPAALRRLAGSSFRGAASRTPLPLPQVCMRDGGSSADGSAAGTPSGSERLPPLLELTPLSGGDARRVVSGSSFRNGFFLQQRLSHAGIQGGAPTHPGSPAGGFSPRVDSDDGTHPTPGGAGAAAAAMAAAAAAALHASGAAGGGSGGGGGGADYSGGGAVTAPLAVGASAHLPRPRGFLSMGRIPLRDEAHGSGGSEGGSGAGGMGSPSSSMPGVSSMLQGWAGPAPQPPSAPLVPATAQPIGGAAGGFRARRFSSFVERLPSALGSGPFPPPADPASGMAGAAASGTPWTSVGGSRSFKGAQAHAPGPGGPLEAASRAGGGLSSPGTWSPVASTSGAAGASSSGGGGGGAAGSTYGGGGSGSGPLPAVQRQAVVQGVRTSSSRRLSVQYNSGEADGAAGALGPPPASAALGRSAGMAVVGTGAGGSASFRRRRLASEGGPAALAAS